MAVEPVLAWHEAVEGSQQVVVGPGADLDDDDPGRRMGHEHGQEAVSAVRRIGREPRAVSGQVEQAAAVPRPDDQLAGIYGKMFRIASRRRPRPPPAGADS